MVSVNSCFPFLLSPTSHPLTLPTPKRKLERRKEREKYKFNLCCPYTHSLEHAKVSVASPLMITEFFPYHCQKPYLPFCTMSRNKTNQNKNYLVKAQSIAEQQTTTQGLCMRAEVQKKESAMVFVGCSLIGKQQSVVPDILVNPSASHTRVYFVDVDCHANS